MPTASKHYSGASIKAPSDDKRWKLVGATMRKHAYSRSALIETLHSLQEAFGYLDDPGLEFVAHGLGVPLSRVYGVATFYSHFRLKPQGKHTCVVCLGTACYIKGGARILEAVEQKSFIKATQTTADKKVSLVTARCLGACGIAPAAVFDGQVLGNITPAQAAAKVGEWLTNE